MKTILASSAIVAAMLFAAAPGAVAQEKGSFCLRGSNSGNLNCAYDTMAQCQAAMKGASTTESCIAKPAGTTGSGAGGSAGAASKSGTAGAAATGGLQQGGSSGGATTGPNRNPQ